MATKIKARKHTSITIDSATKHIKEGEQKTLFCKLLKDFYLIRLAKGGSWRYRYTDEVGKVRHITVGRFPLMPPEVAAQKVYQWIIDDNADPFRDRAERKKEAISKEETRERKTLGHYFNGKFTKDIKKERWPERSIKMNLSWMESNFSHLFSVPMDEIGKTHIDKWAEGQEKRGIAHSTIKRIYTVIRSVVGRALNDGVITETPLKDYKLPSPSFEEEQTTLHTEDQQKEKRRMLSHKEILAVHSGLDAFAEQIRQQRRNSRAHGKGYLEDLDTVAFPHWFVPFCHLALHTGLRPGDIYSLTWQELNIHFNRLKKLTGKSRLAVRKGKRGTVVEVKLNDTIHGIMKAWWEQHGKSTTGLVFPSPVTGDMMTISAHKRPWASVKKLGKISPELEFYALRHHFVSALIAQGKPLLVIAKRAGHKSVDMIQDHYGHLSPSEADEAVDVINFLESARKINRQI